MAEIVGIHRNAELEVVLWESGVLGMVNTVSTVTLMEGGMSGFNRGTAGLKVDFFELFGPTNFLVQLTGERHHARLPKTAAKVGWMRKREPFLKVFNGNRGAEL